MERALYRHAALCEEVVFDQLDAARTLKVEAPQHSTSLGNSLLQFVFHFGQD
jgi:hypothetical protein